MVFHGHLRETSARSVGAAARTHLLVGLLDLVICGRLADAEDGVVVLAHRGAAVGGVGASGRAGKVDRARCAFVFELLLWVRATLGVKS